VAKRAGVSKATIYPWSPSKETLALDALLDWTDASAPPRDTGSLRGDVLVLLRPWVRDIRRRRRRPFGPVIAAFVNEAQSDPQFADAYATHFIERRRDAMRLLHGHAPLTDCFVRDVVDLALDGMTR
jgi:AcrR family transcriptional regulator